ncbi:MAG: flagellar hook-length control protein FliK [Burkholderiaceae bacterium]|nr:flagellar hook-length control protein FliK [Burkholderiaceae bacterium]
MKSLPVINVANGAPAGTPKPASSTSSDQSFGQVLSQQTQQTNAPASNSSTAANGNAQAPSSSNGAPQTGGSANVGNGNTSGGDGTAAAGGKTLKPKHDQDTTTADPSALNGSAQLLALVSNVQQAANPNTNTGTSNSTDALASLAANTVATTQAALANFQAAASTSTSPAKSAVQDAVTDFGKELKAAVTQDATLNNDTESPVAAVTANDSQTTSPLNVVTQDAAPAQPAIDLAASMQKDVQADIANLAQAAAKSADAIRDPVATAAAAAPAMINNAQLSTVASQMSGAEDKLTPQVGSPGWDQALGQKVVWMVAGGQQSASLTLNPPDLGPMQVVLNVNNSHATATFTAAQPEVRQALEAALPKLREMLGDAGIQLGQASVNAGLAQQQQNFADKATPRSGGGAIDALAEVASVISPAAAKVVSGIGLVDTFA